MERNYCLFMLLKSLPSAKSWNLEAGKKGEKEKQISITGLVPITPQAT